MKRPKNIGDKITCIYCKTDIYEAIEPIGDTLESKSFKGINGSPNPKDGEETRCPRCDRNWYWKVYGT
jgi:hypothetical protein